MHEIGDARFAGPPLILRWPPCCQFCISHFKRRTGASLLGLARVAESALSDHGALMNVPRWKIKLRAWMPQHIVELSIVQRITDVFQASVARGTQTGTLSEVF